MSIQTDKTRRQHGDFSGLADNYSRYRPDYAPSVLDCLTGFLKKPLNEVDFVDVGAGTGIWTRMVAARTCQSVIAVEPNADMRQAGESTNAGLAIHWQAGRGDATGLDAHSCDLVTMASSFHWVDFEAGTREFHRILRPGGVFAALWNPRLIEVNPLLVEIEAKLYEMVPHIKRVSSGRAVFTETLTDRLEQSPYFSEVVYLEGRHSIPMTPEAYLGVWKSVNDIQVQAGPETFARFMDYVETKIAKLTVIEATYQTRAWAARRV